MSEEDRHQGEAEPGDGAGDADRDLAERLERERPIPTASFRGFLGRHLAALDPGYGPRPERLWVMVGGYLAIGCLFLLLGLLQAIGAL